MVDIAAKTQGIDAEEQKIAFSDFELCEYKISEETYMVYGPAAGEPISHADFQAGKFDISEDAYAVKFSYAKTQNVEMGTQVYSCRVGGLAHTGNFLVDAEIYDEARMKAELTAEETAFLVADMQENNATHVAKITKGVSHNAFVMFKENDVVITGGNGHWTIKETHPNAKNKPEYL